MKVTVLFVETPKFVASTQCDSYSQLVTKNIKV